MAILINLVEAIQRSAQYEIDGKTITRPQLLVTDGTSTTYCCDVDIGGGGTEGYDNSANLYNININGTVLHNVPLARGNQDLIYAETGSPVRLRRSSSGRYEIIGFSKSMPGTNTRVAVDLDDFSIDPVEDLTIMSRPLTLAELTSHPSFGTTPLGAIAVYKGGTLIKVI